MFSWSLLPPPADPYSLERLIIKSMRSWHRGILVVIYVMIVILLNGRIITQLVLILMHSLALYLTQIFLIIWMTVFLFDN